MRYKYFKRLISFVAINVILLACSDRKTRKIFYEDGSLHEILEYQDGKLNGKRTTYNKDGSMAISTWKDDIKEGKSTIYYVEGQINSISNYKKGALNGRQWIYYESGNLAEIRNYRNDKKVGRQYVYFDNDHNSLYQIKDYIIYHGKDTLCSYRVFDQKGKVVEGTLGINIHHEDSVFKQGEKSEIVMEILGKNFKNTRLLFGGFDDQFYLKKGSKIDTVELKESIFKINVNTTEKGDYYIRGIIDDYEIKSKKGDTTETIHAFAYFEWPYRVE